MWRVLLDKGCDMKDAQERRIEQVERELDRYGVVVGTPQEMKWFGNEVYRVGESVVLTAGRRCLEMNK